MTIYCINPNCKNRKNADSNEKCLSCGTLLTIKNRIRLIKPIRVTEDPFVYTEIFEVDDAGTQWRPLSERRILKILLWNNPHLVKLFEQEAQALQLIRHPNVPQSTIYDDYFVISPESSSLELHCLLMQKFEGQTLDSWIESNGRLSQSLALQWLKQLVEILQSVHRAGFFHRDIKPSNIIVQPNSQLALVDFGGAREITNTYLAKISGSGGKITGGGSQYEITAICTPRYTPLEQINGQAVPQSDFYALGRTFVYCLTGIQLINLPTDKHSGRLIWREKAPQIDRPFADFIEELMSAFPGQRPQTTQVILQRLESLPFKSKLNRVVNSKLFKINVSILGLLATFYFYNAFLYLASRFYFDRASHHIHEPQAAKKDYELAIKFNSQDVDAYNDLALACQQIGDLKCVMNSYEAIFKLKPNMWQAHYGLGNFYDDQKKYKLAEDQYQIAISSNSQAIQPINNLSRLKNISGDYNKSVFLAFKGLKLTKTPELQSALYKNLGWAKFQQKHYAEAKHYLKKAIEFDPQRADAYCLLAQVQEELGETTDSRFSWEVCLIVNSSLPEVETWRQQVLQRLIDLPLRATKKHS